MDRFNEMMAQIQARDSALRNAQDQLEKRVEERTRVLGDNDLTDGPNGTMKLYLNGGLVDTAAIADLLDLRTFTNNNNYLYCYSN
mgnify:CR=1 FL=1